MFQRNFKYFDPDDTGGATDETKPPEPAPVSLDAVKLVADRIADAIAANRPTPVAPVIVDNTAALQAEATKMTEDYDALCADGKYAQASALKDSFMAKVANSQRGDLSNDPVVKTAVTLGKKLAKSENPDIMGKYGSEVEAYVNALPVTERIQPDAWDRAISRVKTDHIEDIIAAERDKVRKEVEGNFVSSGSQGGSRGRKSDASNLDEMQAVAARICGVTEDAYAKRVKDEEAYFKIPASQRGSYEGVPVVSNTITPGKF